MTNTTDTLYVVKTEDERYGVREGGAGQDSPEGYVSRSALKAVVRAALNSKGAIVIDEDVAAQAGRENLELMAQAAKAATGAALVAMAASFTAEAQSVLSSGFDTDAALAQINGTNEDNADEEVDEPAEF